MNEVPLIESLSGKRMYYYYGMRASTVITLHTCRCSLTEESETWVLHYITNIVHLLVTMGTSGGFGSPRAAFSSSDIGGLGTADG